MLGYGYSHLIASRLSKKHQVFVHVVLLAGAALLLPITPDESWKAVAGENPTWRILAVLGVTVGAQYFIIAATSPLLQSWFARSYPGRSPYRLYAVSNTGSMLALLTYPFLIERISTVQTQVINWSLLFVLFMGLSVACGVKLYRTDKRDELSVRSVSCETTTPRPSLGRMLTWIGLSALGSIVLLSTVNKLATDLPAVPFLFILPLSLYLLTFIVAFDNPRWYYRPLFSLLLPVFVITALLAETAFAPLFLLLNPPQDFAEGAVAIMLAKIVLFSLTLFFVCMSCHGELARSKPAPDHLTLFYLVLALGGALGGMFVAIVSPVIFVEIWEYPIGLIGSLTLVLLMLAFDLAYRTRTDSRAIYIQGFRFQKGALKWFSRSIGAVTVVVASFVMLVVLGRSERYEETTFNLSRNFYGTLRVDQAPDGSRHLFHGDILHGSQFSTYPRSTEPTTYYGRSSGVGLAIEHHPSRNVRDRQFRIGGVGMGVGTIAAYALDHNDVLRFYEINPDIISQAHSYFSYLELRR